MNELTTTQGFFLAILKDHIHGSATIPKPDVDWKEICDCSKRHQLSGITYYQCKSYLETQRKEDYEKELSLVYLQSIYSSKQRDIAYRSISAAFSGAGISFFSVKGKPISVYYPIPCLRTMGDIDIILSPEDRKKAHEILLNMGYANTIHGSAEWTYIRNGIEIELHDKLVYEQYTDYSCFFNDCWDYVVTENGENILDLSFHFIYLILHLRKHLISFGVGFRQFMDIALMAKANIDLLDWKWITEKLGQLHLLAFAKQCAEFCMMWFAIDIPIRREAIEPEFYIEATKNIFANGVFGFNSDMNSDVNINQISINAAVMKTSLKRTMFRKTVQSIFPPYETLSIRENYVFLKTRPYLLPMAWLYRIWVVISQKNMHQLTRVASDVKTAAAKADSIEIRAGYLKKWKI